MTQFVAALVSIQTGGGRGDERQRSLAPCAGLAEVRFQAVGYVVERGAGAEFPNIDLHFDKIVEQPTRA
jgi:hypothetical protein